jgi:nucleotide-binding universal stress UspA family protein
MRILFAVDDQRYSKNALLQLAQLGENTWADITILGIINHSENAKELLNSYYEELLEYFDPKNSPYLKDKTEKNSINKFIVTQLRKGNPTKEILEESKKENSNLIVIGCDSQKGCEWTNSGSVPLKVARDASCSVLVIKENKKINRILCCLDHDNISQDSIEMLNQMITLFKANLDIIILTENEDLSEKIQKKLFELINYYTLQDIYPCIELVSLHNLEAFVTNQARWGIMSMFMGKKSLMEKVFPSNKLSRLLNINESSVLLLR